VLNCKIDHIPFVNPGLPIGGNMCCLSFWHPLIRHGNGAGRGRVLTYPTPPPFHGTQPRPQTRRVVDDQSIRNVHLKKESWKKHTK